MRRIRDFDLILCAAGILSNRIRTVATSPLESDREFRSIPRALYSPGNAGFLVRRSCTSTSPRCHLERSNATRFSTFDSLLESVGFRQLRDLLFDQSAKRIPARARRAKPH